jgi:hypothetical protein
LIHFRLELLKLDFPGAQRFACQDGLATGFAPPSLCLDGTLLPLVEERIGPLLEPHFPPQEGQGWVFTLGMLISP